MDSLALAMATAQKNFSIAAILLKNGAEISESIVIDLLKLKKPTLQESSLLTLYTKNVYKKEYSTIQNVFMAALRNRHAYIVNDYFTGTANIQLIDVFYNLDALHNLFDITNNLKATKYYYEIQEQTQNIDGVDLPGKLGITTVKTAIEKIIELVTCNYDTEYTKTIMLISAATGNTQILEALLQHGVTHNIRENETGLTPLYYAVQYDRPECLRLLLEYDADPNNYYGMTPIHYAASKGHLDCLTLLLEHGTNPDRYDTLTLTPLHYAAQNRHLDCLTKLLEYGANPNSQGERQRTALHFAAYRENTDYLKELLEHGAAPNIQDEEQQTPLHITSYYGDTDHLTILLEHGADPNIQDNKGKTPLDMAKEKKNHHACIILQKYGARTSWLQCPLM